MRKRSNHTVIANQEPGQPDLPWVFLAEYSLEEWKQKVERGNEPVAGLRFHELEIPPEVLNQVVRTLADFAHQAILPAHPGAPKLIRLFCQDTMIMAGSTAEGLLLKQTVSGPEMILPVIPKMSGGWGYFLIERNGGISEDRAVSSPDFIDLYLYREGK